MTDPRPSPSSGSKPGKKRKKNRDSPTRWAHLQHLFHETLAMPRSERKAFLERTCTEDPSLQEEIRSLIEAMEAGLDFVVDDSAEPDSEAEAPEHIGPYKILETLGEGGMGIVYVAEDVSPVRRKVAIKVIKRGMDTKEVLARFQQEHHALTLMSHPNIAQVYKADATDDGRPYFVMEWVPGVPLTEFCDRECLNTCERLELFIEVCKAAEHAHQKGVIHRDLKPSNILVTFHEGDPVPKIIDFGVAKATEQRLAEETVYTKLGQIIGTPEYMSPEQAERSGSDVDHRTDVYSLGVILYELLAGALPFDRESLYEGGYAEMQRRIREVEPPRPSTRVSARIQESRSDSEIAARQRRTDPRAHARQLRGDLDWITMRALEKARMRRYASAADLAAEVRRFLSHEPVLAGPPNPLYRLKKYVVRHRAWSIGVAAVLAALISGALISRGLDLAPGDGGGASWAGDGVLAHPASGEAGDDGGDLADANISLPPVASPPRARIENPGFEDGEAGGAPRGWDVSRNRAARIDSSARHRGRQCLRIAGSGLASQHIDAVRLRGRRIRFSAWCRIVTSRMDEANATLGLSIKAAKDVPIFVDRMASRRLRATEWTHYHIDAFVPPEAVSIPIEVKFYGKGTAFFDDITIQVLGKGRLAAEPPRAVTGRGLENLVAFTKLYGYVRWFHPADQAAADVDWNTLAVEGVRAVESAGDTEELARRLEELFQSYAPTLQVYPAGSPPAEAPPVLEAGKKISRQMHIVYWKHRGLGTSYAASRYYRSERTYEQARAGEVPEGVPDPRVPYEADLGGGVVCRIPTALFARRNKTLPQSRKQPPGFDEEVVNNGDDCATRIAAVVVAWNLFQHFFPALDRAEVDWTAELPGALRRAALAPDTEAGIEVLERMIATTDDAFGRIIHPWRPHAWVEHLPIHWQWIEKRVVITAVAPGHPEVRVGDVVLELDGRNMQERVAKRVELQGASTPDYKMVRVLQSLRMGQVNSESRLLLQWGDAEPRTVTLKREPKFRNLRTRSTPAFSELEEGVYYIDLDRFKYAQIEKKLEHLVGARGIIIDYRGFVWGADLVGHFIDEPVQLGHLSYALMTRPDQSDLELEKVHGLLAPGQPRLGAKLAFLIDARACGPPETVLMSVEHYKMGALVGTPTGGQNGMINRVKVPGEYIVQWTGAKARKQGGEPLLGNGVRPTVEVNRTVRGVMEGRDEVLERAIEVVTEE